MTTPTLPRFRTRDPGVPRARPVRVLLLALLTACGGDDGIVDPVIDPPTDPCSVLTPIGMGQSLGGTLSSTDCIVDGFRTDHWELNLTSATSVLIDLSSSSFDTTLEVRNAGGEVVAFNDDWGGLDSRILQDLAAGRYRLMVRAFSRGSGGAYRLSVAEGPDCSDRDVLSLNVVFEGALGAGDCFSPVGGFIDWYRLELTESRKLRMDAIGVFDEVLLVADADGNPVNGAGWDTPAGHARLDMQLPAGTWRLGVTALSESEVGGYTLFVADAPPCGPGGDLVLGETLEGTITADACLFEGFALADSVGLELDAATDLHIQAKSAGRFPVVVVRDTAGSDVAVAFTTSDPSVAETRATLPAGRYAVYVFIDSGPGDYALTVSEVVCTDAGSFAFGDTVEGTLDASDCARSQGQLQEVWTFTLDAERAVRFDLKSAEFDAYLVVEDADGNELGSDDDGGVGTDSRLDLTLAAGDYTVRASSFGVGQAGRYTLSAGAPAAGSPGASPGATSDPGAGGLRGSGGAKAGSGTGGAPAVAWSAGGPLLPPAVRRMLERAGTKR